MQDVELDAVPGPALAGLAARRSRAGAEQRMAGLERARERATRERASTACAPPTWSTVAVAEHQQVDARVAAGAQQRHQHALAGVAVARVLRAGVEQQRRGRACARAPRCPGRRRRRAGRSGPRPAARAAATAAAAPAAAPAGEPATAAAGRQRRPPAGRRPAPTAAPPAPSRPRRATPASSAGSASSPCTARRRAATAARAQDAEQRQRRHAERDDGIATRFASKPTSDTCWKKTSVSGARPSVATTCVRRPRARRRQRAGGPARRPGAASPARARPRRRGRRRHQQADRDEREPEARLHQRPGIERGDDDRGGEQHQRPGPAQAGALQQATAASIQTVRCAGTPQPEKTA